MAPRKKRAKARVKTNRKTRSSTKGQPVKPTEEPEVAADAEENILEKQDTQIQTRTASTHKKFGKFRCLLETTGNSETGLETEEEQSSETPAIENTDYQENEDSSARELQDVEKEKMDLEECVDTMELQEIEEENAEIEQTTTVSEIPIVLQEAAVLTECDNNTVIELTSEISLQPSEMEYAEVEEQNMEGLATEVTDQLSNLNFNVDSNSADVEHTMSDSVIVEEKLESPNQIFNVDTIQSEFTVECVSEEIVPVLGEQEIEIGDISDVEATVEDSTTTDDILEQSTFTAAVDQQAEGEAVVKAPGKSSRSKNTKSTSQKNKPKISTRKKPVPVIKTNKKEAKNKNKDKKSVEKINSDTSESSITSEKSVRRSSRIKSISVLKLRSKGQGLVKPKTDVEVKKPLKGSLNVNDSDTSENSNSGHTDSEKASADSPNFLAPNTGYDSDHKPVKVKSRWRRSSELEMGNSVTINSNKNVEGVHAQLPTAPLANDDKSENTAANDEEIRSRLKQFIHLKENHYMTSRVSCKEAKKMICDCFLTSEEIDRGELACGEDCLNRLLMIECGSLCPINDRCTNKRFQKSQFSPCEVFRTDKKGLGIRATADIAFGEFILEYIGEVIGPDEFEERATEYSKGKNPHYYFMSLRADAVIDATQKGNISRFINHSCEPNAETQKWTVNGELRIGFFSKRTILAGEEITFDYQFQRYGKEAQKCFCEAPTCRGWLGEEPDEDEEEEEEEDEVEYEEEVVQPEVEQQSTEIVEEVQEKPRVEIEVPAEQTTDTITLPTITTTTTTIIVTAVTTPTASVEVDVKKPVKKEKRKIIKRKVLKDIFDDVDVDEEIEMLIATGLKNQAHTLKLSRLMVRANEASQRTALLRILRHGEFPCRRLFLDYHGLRLIHGWMNDAQQMCKTDKKQESLRLELLQTLATLPIPNKTMLQDSKVLSTVETWSTKLEDVSAGLDSESNSPKLETDSTAITEIDNNTEIEMQEESTVKIEKETQKENTVKIETEMQKENIAKIENESQLKTFSNKSMNDKVEETKVKISNIENDAGVSGIQKFTMQEEDVEEIRRSVGMDIEEIRSKNRWLMEQTGKKVVQDIIDMFEDDMEISPIAFNEDDNIIEIKEVIKQPEAPKQDFEVEIIALAVKLLEEWSVLKEVFRIPKKERIEQMKEHEREANRGYKAGLEHDSERKSRYRGLYKHRSSEKIDFSERVRKGLKMDDRSTNPFPKINKHERRKLFAMQVEQEEVEKRLKQRDIWRQHEFQCMAMGADPRFTTPFDSTRNYQCIWNQPTGQWQNYPIAINHNPLLNPSMAPRFGSGMQYSYSTGNNVPPLPNMPPPLPNMSLPAPSMPLTTVSMSHPASGMSLPSPSMSHPTPNYSHPVANMPHPAPIVSHPPMNMSLPPLNMSTPAPNMPHPPSNVPHPHPNFPHQVPNMPHPALNMPHPPPNMPHPPPNMPHPPPNMPHPPPNMTLPPPNISHPSQNLSITNIPTNIPPPLPNMPPLPQLSNNPMLSNVPPLPMNSMSSISGNPVNNMPPLPNVPPPLPNIPPPLTNMQQVSNISYQEEKASEKEDLLQVKFAGPIPPPVKLPPKWKCAKDKYGRPYYYHIKIRISQWEPPEFPPPVEIEEESSDTTSSSETSSLSSDSSSEDSDDDDDPDDTKLLLEIRRKFQQMESLPKSSPNAVLEQESKELSPDDSNSLKSQEQFDETVNESVELSKTTSLDERLKEEFNLSKRDSQGKEPPLKRKRLGLVTEVHIISPRSEEDKILAKENLRKYKENKEKLKRQKELNAEQSKKRVKVTVKNPRPSKKHKSTVKTKLKEAMDLNSEAAKKIKESFRSNMAGVMVGILNPYRKPDCKEGRITNTEDFKHLARKLTHFVMLKELKHCQSIDDLTCTESVKSKAKEFVRKYMSKFGEIYTRPKDDLDD